VLLLLLLLLLMMMMMMMVVVVVVVVVMMTTTMLMMIIMTTMMMLFWDLQTCSTRARWILVLWPPQARQICAQEQVFADWLNGDCLYRIRPTR